MPVILAGALVFLTSGSVLVLEILAGRLLAPYVGVSLDTFTGIIGTVLAGIALGSWLGGRLADREAPERLLGPILIVGGLLALAAVPVLTIFGELRLGSGPVAIVILAVVAFFAPAAVLSAVNPTVAKLQLSRLEETGTVVGRLSAVATAGALAGTFVSGFLLVAAFPSRPIVIGLGLLLVLLGVVAWLGLRRQPGPSGPGGALLMVAAVILSLGSAAAAGAAPNPCQTESTYFCARIEPDPDRPTGRTLVLDTLRHSYVDLADPTYLEFTYTQILSDVVAVVASGDEPIRALHMGGGGFSMPRYIAATRPGSTNRVLELDANLVRLDMEKLGLRLGDGLDVRIGDARLLLPDEPAGAYDLVIGDAFGSLSVPWHLTTVEFLGQVRERLGPGGIYAMNLIDRPPLRFAGAELATMRQVFPHVALVAPPARIQRESGGNFILLGANDRLPAAGIQARNRERGDDDLVVVDAAELDAFAAGAPVLTDDYAPVDQLIGRER